MEQKKIATSVDILINVGAYEHIQITKYAEKNISYASTEDMLKQEDQLTEELTNDIIRTMRSIPTKLGKKTTANVEIEEKIAKKLPEWLKGNVEPNIANNAIKTYDSNKAKANAEKTPVETDLTVTLGITEEETAKLEEKDLDFDVDGEDLFK